MEYRWGGQKGLFLQLLEAILAWRRMSNLTTAHWKRWSCQYQWSNSTESQTPYCPSFSWTILILVSLFSRIPSAGAGIYITEGSVSNSLACLFQLPLPHPQRALCAPVHSAPTCASCLKSGNTLKTLLHGLFTWI